MKYTELDINKDRKVPLNTRQSGDTGMRMVISMRIRKSPFWHKFLESGAWCCTVYNRMFHPRAYARLEDGGLMKEYEYLTQHVSLWNVAVERQIRVKGPDAADFVNRVITRDVHKKLPPGRACYVILCNEKGGIINDPILMRIGEDEFWFSISDSDVQLCGWKVSTPSPGMMSRSTKSTWRRFRFRGRKLKT